MLNDSDAQINKLANQASLEKAEYDKYGNKLRALLGNDFHYLKHVGTGISGDVYLCKYTGHVENIKQLCDEQGRLCVKIADKNYKLDDESIIAEELFQKQIPITRDLINIVGVAIKDREAIVALCMNYVSFKEMPTDTITFSLKSFLKTFYQSIVNGHVRHKEFPDKVLNGFYQDIGIFCVQMINEMQSILRQFNTMGYLHLDVGARNFILNKPIVDNEGNVIKLPLVLCDYGLSGKCNEHGVVNTTPQYNKKPLTARNYQDISENKATVLTDIFAIKTAIIGMISLIISNMLQDYSILSIGQKSIEQFHQMRTEHEYFKSDTIVLTQFLQLMMQHIDHCSDRHVRNQINHLMVYFREYILTLPNPNLSGEVMHQHDQEKLLSINVKYFNSVIESKITHIKDINNDDELMSFLMSIKRLMVIPVTGEFRSSAKYQQFMALDTIDKLRHYLADKVTFKSQPSEKHHLDSVITEGAPQIAWITKINEFLNQWHDNRKDNVLEIKWVDEEMTQRTYQIIDKIMDGKIKSYEEARGEYLSLLNDINNKINIKRQSSFGKYAGVLLNIPVNVAGYEFENKSKEREASFKEQSNVGGYEGQQEISKENIPPRRNSKKKDK